MITKNDPALTKAVRKVFVFRVNLIFTPETVI